MKIRTGFVSNSSSSSFIVNGFKIDSRSRHGQKLREEYYNENDGFIEKDFDIIETDYEYYIGNRVKEFGDLSYEDNAEFEFSESDLKGMFASEKIKKASEFLGNEKEPALIMVTAYS